MFKKSFIIPILSLALAIPALAQGPLKAKAGQHVQMLKLARLKKALNLTPDQVSGLRTLVQANKTQRQTLAESSRQKAQTLRDLTAQNNPNPTEVGNALLALKQARGQTREMRQQTLEKFKSTLTPDQIKTLDELQARRKGLEKK